MPFVLLKPKRSAAYLNRKGTGLVGGRHCAPSGHLRMALSDQGCKHQLPLAIGVISVLLPATAMPFCNFFHLVIFPPWETGHSDGCLSVKCLSCCQLLWFLSSGHVSLTSQSKCHVAKGRTTLLQGHTLGGR